jgi:single-strand DNA-binding protein
MSGSLNRVMLIGRLGRDPEMRYTPSGQPVANFSLATDESYKDKGGQKVEKSEWHRIVAWGKQAEFCGNYLAKGRLVYVEGKLETRKWTDKDGAEKYTTEIRADRVMGLDSKQDARGGYDPEQDFEPAPKFPNNATGMDGNPF